MSTGQDYIQKGSHVIYKRKLREDVQAYADSLNFPKKTGTDLKVYRSFILSVCWDVVKKMQTKHGANFEKAAIEPFKPLVTKEKYLAFYPKKKKELEERGERRRARAERKKEKEKAEKKKEKEKAKKAKK